MKIADILGLRQREKLRPSQRQRILDEPADFELPRLDGDVRVLAKIHDGPVPHFALSDRQLRHAVPVRLTGPRRLATGEFDVDRALVERDLPVDIFLTAFDEVAPTHEHIVSTRRDEARRVRSHVDPRSAEVVVLRFYSGLSVPEVAEHMGLSARSVERMWTY